MHVLFFTYHFPYPEQSGSFRPWIAARILRQMNHDVTVITTGIDYITGESKIGRRLFKVEYRDGIKVVKVFTMPHYRTTGFKRIVNYTGYAVMAFLAALFQHRPDKIFIGTTSYFITFSSFLYMAIKGLKIPYVIDERDLFLESSVALGVLQRGVLYRILDRWDYFFRTNAECIFTVSGGMKQTLIEKGIRESKIKVVPSIDVELAKVKIEQHYSSKENFHGKDKKFTIMYTGSFGMANDIMTILKAASSLENSCRDDIEFILVGGGEKLSIYQEYVRKNCIRNVKIIPAMGREDARSLLLKADVCVHAFKKNRLWDIALSSKIFDYLLFEKPILFCGKGEIKRLIERSGAGFCAEPQDSMALAANVLWLYSRREKLSEMGRRGCLYVKEHYPIESIYASFKAEFSSDD